MKTLSITYPESLLISLSVSDREFEREARLTMALKLFELGRFSLEQAAVVAGYTTQAFIDVLALNGIPAADAVDVPHTPAKPKVELVRDSETGRIVLTREPGLPPITTETVNDLLNELQGQCG